MTQPSRRDFLKTSSVAAALGTGLLSSVSARAFASNDDTIRIGLVGCGGRGSGAAEQALSTKGKVKLVAMGDAFEDRLQSSLKNLNNAVQGNETAEIAVDDDHKFVGLDAYKQVIDSDIDLVILATPPGFRPIHFDYAVQAGKNVFMEKPVSTDAPGIRKVLEAARVAKDKGLKVGVGLQRRHQPNYLEYVKRIQEGDLGKVHALRVYWNGGGVWDPPVTHDDVKTEMEYQLRNWYYHNWLCGDHIVEQHIHNIDVGNWIMKGFPVKANGMGGREVRTAAKYGEIFDHHAVEFTYEDGTVMMSQCRHIPNCWNSVTEHAHCEKGIVHMDSNPRATSMEWYDGKKERFRGANDNPYQVEHDDLFAAIRNNQDYNEAEYGAMSTMSAILGRMCTYSGKEITMQEALERGHSVMPTEFTWDAKMPKNPGPDGFYPVPVPGVTEVLT